MTGASANLSPALRLHIVDPGVNNVVEAGDIRAELIWEFEQNGGSGNSFGTWRTLDANTTAENFYRFVGGYFGGGGNTGRSATTVDGLSAGQLNLTFSQWPAYASVIYDNDSTAGTPLTQPNFSANAYIAAISVGVGSSFGSNYLAYADTVRIRFGVADQTVYSFEEVPEPATYALITSGLGIAFLLRRRR